MTAYFFLPARARALHNRDPEADIAESTRELAALLKAGESVSVGHNNVLTPERVDEHAFCNDLSHDEACDQLAVHYEEQWSYHEWVNS